MILVSTGRLFVLEGGNKICVVEDLGGKCCDRTSGRCYASKDMGVDGASLWWSYEKKVLIDSKNIEEILPHKAEEQTVYIWSSVDAPEDPSDIYVSVTT